jgi:predicted nucleic acid-binding protein
MIYLDTSVALAQLLGEDRTPPDAIWNEVLVSSRLLEYELFTRINARGLARSHTSVARELLDRVALADLSTTVLARAVDAFPVAVRTLDALHLATADYLVRHGQAVEIATYDRRMMEAATALGLPLASL